MAANSPNDDIHRGRTGQGVTRGIPYLAGLQVVGVVQGKRVVWTGKPAIKTVVEHGLGAADRLFGWLANQHQRSVPAVLEFDQHLRGSEKRGDVNIVSTRMHYADVLASVVFGSHFARVR